MEQNYKNVISTNKKRTELIKTVEEAIKDYGSFPPHSYFKANGLLKEWRTMSYNEGINAWADYFNTPIKHGYPKNPMNTEDYLLYQLSIIIKENNNTFPSVKWFKDNNKQNIYQYISALPGGIAGALDKIGVDIPKSSTTRKYYTKETIEKELREFINKQDLKEVPSQKQFYESNNRSLYRAMVQNGGIKYWRNLFS